jgi:hypothetical protein
MTVLHYVLEEQAVYLLTDTVVSDPATMRPLAFTSKVFSPPHWQGVMTGAGICPFVVEWSLTSMSTRRRRAVAAATGWLAAKH